MGESEGSVFWGGKEDGYDGSFMSENLHGNQCFEAAFQGIYDGESAARWIRLPDPESNQQSSPLGLTLRKTPSFLRLLQNNLSKAQMEDLGSHQSTAEKLKASNFPIMFINIGSWQRFTRHEGDLTAKLYYAKRKLVWEVLVGAFKSKIEIQWSDIIAIRAVTPENEPGILEIELNEPPLFYHEINPQPRKHTLWQQTSDFTGGQAPILRRHHVTFQPGILDKHYEKLLQCDKRLLALSRKPFPSHASPYFDSTMFGLLEHSMSFNIYGSGYPPRVQYPYQIYPTMPRGPPLRPTPNPPVSVMSLPLFGGSSNQFVTQQATHYGQEPLHNFYQPNMALLNDIQYQSHVVSSDHDGTLGAKGDSMDGNPNFGYADETSGDHGEQNARNMNPTIDGVYSHHVNWMPLHRYGTTKE